MDTVNMVVNILNNNGMILQSTVPSIVTALMTTTLMRKNAQISEVEKLRQGHFFAIAEDLLDKGQITFLEFYKCKNFLKIAKKADDYYNITSDGSNVASGIDYDWFIKFYESAGLITDEHMQNLYARAMAKQIETGSIPFSLIHCLSTIDSDTLQCFNAICSLSVRHETRELSVYPLIYISESAYYYQKFNIKKYMLARLNYFGLIEYNEVKEFVLPKNNPSIVYGSTIISFDSEERINIGNVRLTLNGRILWDIVDKSLEPDLIEHCLNILQNRGISYTSTDNPD